jgi:hypothetical protein
MKGWIMETDERKYVDILVNHFWKLGYFTISRRFGTFLPEPSNVGKFKVDIIGRQKNRYAIGITFSEEDLNDKNLIEKFEFLASRKTRNSNSPVLLIIGVQSKYYRQVKNILDSFSPDIRKNIKLTQILDKSVTRQSIADNKHQIVFS